MRTLQLEKTSASFRKTASLAEKEVIVLTKNGRPALALVGLKDDMTLEALSLGRNEAFMSYLDGIGDRAKRGRTYSLEEIKGEFGLRSPLPKPRKPRGLKGIRIKGGPVSDTAIEGRR